MVRIINILLYTSISFYLSVFEPSLSSFIFPLFFDFGSENVKTRSLFALQEFPYNSSNKFSSSLISFLFLTGVSKKHIYLDHTSFVSSKNLPNCCFSSYESFIITIL